MAFRVQGLSVSVSQLICEASLAHPQGDNHPFFRPIESNGTAELSGHAAVDQLTSEAFKPSRCGDRRTTPLRPRDDHLIVIGIVMLSRPPRSARR